MAGFLGINSFSFGNVTSYGSATPKVTINAAPDAPKETVGSANNENLGLIQRQPQATASAAPITLQVSASQLASQGFQETLRSLAASGIPVQVLLAADQSLAGGGELKQDVDQLKSRQSTQESRLSNVEHDLGYLSSDVQALKYQAPAPKPQPPVHHTPSYGSD